MFLLFLLFAALAYLVCHNRREREKKFSPVPEVTGVDMSQPTHEDL